MTQVLKGVRVIELGTMITAPLAGMMLADLGADVIKIEHPQGGDPFRSFRGGRYSPHFVAYNRGKRGMQLDLRSAAGREIFQKLLVHTDILIENYRAGVMERLGLGAGVLAATNRALIHCSITGFGTSGPYCGRPAYDSVGLALSGIASLLLDPDHPQICGPTIPDNATGMFACYGILGALYERERTGKGRVVEVSMQDAIYASLASNYGMLHARGAAAPARTGNRHGGLGISPYNAYPTLDGYVVLNAPGDHHFRAMLDVMGRPDLKDDPRFLTRSTRVANFAAVDELIERWTKTLTKDEVARRMLAAAVPCAAVRDLAEVMNDENMHARGSLQWINHPDLGRVVLPHSPLVFEGTERRPIEPSLPLGASNEAVFGKLLGHSDDELKAYEKEGVI